MKLEPLKILIVKNQQDLDACLKIRNIVFVKEKRVSEEIEKDEYDFLDSKCDHFLLKYQNKAIGTCRCLYDQIDGIKLQRLCILKEYRKLGFGSRILHWLEDYYNTRNKKYILMDAKYQVVGFYEKCGYQKISDTFIEAGIEHITMMKNL